MVDAESGVAVAVAVAIIDWCSRIMGGVLMLGMIGSSGERKRARNKPGVLNQFFEKLIPWHKLPLALGLARLIQLRDALRARNLHDTRDARSDAAPRAHGTGGNGRDPSALTERTADGTYNDLSDPLMGAADTRFGRNIPLEHTRPDVERLMHPNPRIISEQLLARTKFAPATTLNLLAASWIQFMTADWFSHGKNETEDPLVVPLPAGDDWSQCPMRIQRTRRDPTQSPASRGGPTYVNTVTHWWDGSQVYGSSADMQKKVRAPSGGKLAVEENGLLPVDPQTGLHQTGFESDTMWLGRSMLHTLFTKEHNLLCERLREEYPTWDDETIFAKSRLIVSALMAKIHTVEWTPALLSHPTTSTALHVNWFGIETEKLQRAFGRLTEGGDLVSGIPGSETNHHACPYALTEEFVAVYRMHSLIPDWYTLRSHKTDEVLREVDLRGTLGREGRAIAEQLSMEDLFYSFGRMHPGALRLHNYPRFLRELTRGDGTKIDLATVDIVRDRERGIPRYNALRALLGMPIAKRFSDITSDPTWQKELARIYENDVDAVDLLVGTLAEDLPDGFAFSDTQFRIFILMASRRLKSDRFFTVDFSANVYTPLGMKWIQETDMRSLLLRHVPGVGSALRGVDNAFAPWRSVATVEIGASTETVPSAPPIETAQSAPSADAAPATSWAP